MSFLEHSRQLANQRSVRTSTPRIKNPARRTLRRGSNGDVDWFTPDTDTAGCANVLAADRSAPCGATTCNTNLVDIAAA
jgi:hypothetical protein